MDEAKNTVKICNREMPVQDGFRSPPSSASKVQPADSFLPRNVAESKEIVSFPVMQHFAQTRTASQVVTPDFMQKSGRVLLGYGRDKIIITDSTIRRAVDERRLGRYIERGFAVFKMITTKNGEYEAQITNFSVHPQAIVTVITVNGEDAVIECEIKVKAGSFIFEISLKEYGTLFFKKLQEKHPEIRILQESRNPRGDFNEYASLAYEAVMCTLPKRKRYDIFGWIDDGGKPRFISGRDPDCVCKRKLATIDELAPKTLFEWGWRMLNIAEKHVSIIMFLQMHIGVAAKLLGDAGVPPEYIFAIVGKTGNRKTSAARVYYTAYPNFDEKGDEDCGLVNFIGTEAGLLFYAEQRRDANLLIDDLNSIKKGALVETLNYLLRQFGDGVGRVKTTGGGQKLYRVKLRCGIVISAESQLETLQPSARLRTLELKTHPTSVNNDELACYQTDIRISKLRKQPSKVEYYLSLIIRHFEQNYYEILAFISSYHPPAFRLRFARHQRIYKIFCALSLIILQFGEKIGFFNPGESLQIFSSEWLPAIQALLRENEQNCSADEPFEMFLRAISTGIAQRQLVIASDKCSYVNSAFAAAGFFDGSILKISPEIAYDFSRKFYRERAFTATANDIWGELLERGFSQGYGQKGHKAKPLKKIRVNNSTMSVLCLDWPRCTEFLNDASESLE